MKKKFKITAAALGIMAAMLPNIYAASTITYNFNQDNVKYKILLDGQSYTIPDNIEYNNSGKITSISLANFKESIKSSSSSVKAIDYDNGKLTYNGSYLSSKISNNEYIALFNNLGISLSSTSNGELAKIFEKSYLPSIRSKDNQKLVELYNNSTDETKRANYKFRIDNFNEDITRAKNIQLESKNMTIASSIPYLAVQYEKEDKTDMNAKTINTNINVNYYKYSIIFRDLRILSMKYKIGSESAQYVPNFNKDTYSYVIKLPESVPDNATITTISEGYMNKILEDNNVTGVNLGLETQDDTIQLKGGMGTAKVKTIFKVKETYGGYLDSDIKADPERTYTITFTKYDFLKGDLDKNGIVDANDAAVALDLYKYNSATKDDLEIGDMDENGLIDANDASLILDVYKYGN